MRCAAQPARRNTRNGKRVVLLIEAARRRHHMVHLSAANSLGAEHLSMHCGASKG